MKLNAKLIFEVFNALMEIIILLGIAIICGADVDKSLLVCSLYTLIKLVISIYENKTKNWLTLHYKKWSKCLLWTTLIFVSLYNLTHLNYLTIITLTILSALLSTHLLDIKNVVQWNNERNEDGSRKSKHDDVIQYIRFNQFADKVKDYEKSLEKTDNMLYIFYIERFKNRDKPTAIAEKYNITTKELTVELDKIAFAIRVLKNS